MSCNPSSIVMNQVEEETSEISDTATKRVTMWPEFHSAVRNGTYLRRFCGGDSVGYRRKEAWGRRVEIKKKTKNESYQAIELSSKFVKAVDHGRGPGEVGAPGFSSYDKKANIIMVCVSPR